MISKGLGLCNVGVEVNKTSGRVLLDAAKSREGLKGFLRQISSKLMPRPDVVRIPSLVPYEKGKRFWLVAALRFILKHGEARDGLFNAKSKYDFS